MHEPAQNAKHFAILCKSIGTLKLFIAFTIAYFCCFSLGQIYVFSKKVLKHRLQ